MWVRPALIALSLAATAQAACVPNTTSQAVIQQTLQKGGPGYTLSLCPEQVYSLSGPLKFTAANQEISTEGYPTDESRATLLVKGKSTCAVNGKADGMDGVALRNVQIDGNRVGNAVAPTPNDGGNIEMGGNNQGQLVEYVRTFNPKGWTCLHM